MKRFALIALALSVTFAAKDLCAEKPMNVLFIISDDLTATALSCYGNTVCSTPNIDAIAAKGTRFTRAYCQGTYCGPSRASFMSGYYPHATGTLGYTNPRPMGKDGACVHRYNVSPLRGWCNATKSLARSSSPQSSTVVETRHH